MKDLKQHGWIAWFAANPVAANLLMGTILIAGLYSAFQLRIEAFPPLPPSLISIQRRFRQGCRRRHCR